MIVYGINAVAEAVRAGRAREVRVADRTDARVRAILDEAERRRVPVRRVPREALDQDAAGGRHQGVVAEVAGAPAATLEALARPGDPPPLVVVLDGVEDPQNVGAVLRTVDAAGASGVVRQSRRAAPLAGAAARASAGAVHHVPVADVVNIARALEELKALGVWCVGLDAEAERPYYELDLTVPTALVVGAEGHGLRRLVRDRCDLLAAIPMSGRVSSLNVSAAAAIVLFEAVRQRRSRGRQ
ncbi:MAG: 23S rRNA (guanosine(2251)-2'-O)-methyltransferase RlmB [Acidobacteriota bacterium]